MTDKEQIKAIIKQYADKGKTQYRECCDDNESASLINYWDGYRDCAYNLLRELDDMQEECNITGIKSKHATGKLKELVDNVSEEGLEEARKQLEELTKECMYSKDNYTDEDRKALCEGCDEECMFNKKEDLENEVIKKILYYSENFHKAPWAIDSTGAVMPIWYAKFGANWQKEQLMAKAIDATVHIDAGGYPYIPQMELYDYDKDIPLAKEGDKYKVVLIKES